MTAMYDIYKQSRNITYLNLLEVLLNLLGKLLTNFIAKR